MIPNRWHMLLLAIDWVMICAEMGALRWNVVESVGDLAEAR